MTLTEFLSDMGNAVRNLTGKTDKIKPSAMPEELNSVYNAERLLDKSITEIKTSVSSIPDYAFYNQNKLVSVDMPNITKIGAYAFNLCSEMESIVLPDTVTYIASSAFKQCLKLKNINIPYGVTEIPNGCFSGCISLEKINIPDTVKNVGSLAFNESRVEVLDFARLTQIGQQSFRQASTDRGGLQTLIIRTTIGVCALSSANSFSCTPISQGNGFIYVPDKLVDSYKTATNWSVYANQIKPLSELESEVSAE